MGASGAAAGRLIAWMAPGSRMPLFGGCVALHAGFAAVSGLWGAGLVALAGFAVSFAALRAARDTWPLGHPGAPG